MTASRAIAFAAAVLTAMLLPIVLWQGVRLRRTVLRLPPGAGDPTGVAGAGGVPLGLLVLGESPVAGVGVATQAESLAARLAVSLGAALGRPVAWRVLGRNGVTARRARTELCPLVERPAEDDPVDLVVIALGVNDVVDWTTPGRWRGDLVALVRTLRARLGETPVLLAGVPPVGRFPAMPAPLSAIFGMRVRALDRAAAIAAAGLPRARHAPFDAVGDAGHFAADGFHPSAAGCAVWGAHLAAAAVELLRAVDVDAAGPGRC